MSLTPHDNYKTAVLHYKKQNLALAFSHFSQAAKRNHTLSQYYLAVLYQRGKGTPQDYHQAFRWFKLVAEKGDDNARYKVGDMYYHGQGVTQDLKKAMLWFTKAANNGHPASQNYLAFLYQLQSNFTDAFFWYKVSADADNTDAQNNLGNMYHQGLGILKDYPLALDYYQRSAEKGNVFAQQNIAYLYRFGFSGVPQNLELSLHWYHQSALSGNPSAQLELAKMYLEGLGTSINPFLAQEWFTTAFNNGNQDAKTFISDCNKI